MARRGENIHKRKDGRWEGRYKNGYKPDGSIKYSSVYSTSYTECKQKLFLAKIKSEKENRLPKKDMLFSDVLSDWLNFTKVKIKGGTEAKYRHIIETHIVPSLGGLKMQCINSNIVNEFLNSKIKSGGLATNKPLSPSYVRTMAIVIESAINYAVKEEICKPLKTAIYKPPITKNNISVLSEQDEVLLTQKIISEPSLVGIGVLLALQCGLRIGEVCALRWEDIDFVKGLIHIRHTISRVPCRDNIHKTMLILDKPKTPSSIRDIPIPSSLREILMSFYQSKSSEFVISSANGFVGTRTFDYQYRKLLKEYDFSIFNFHTLRHTYATRCASAGMDAKMLSQLLGHSSSNISLNIYVHPSIDFAIKLIDNIYASA